MASTPAVKQANLLITQSSSQYQQSNEAFNSKEQGDVSGDANTEPPDDHNLQIESMGLSKVSAAVESVDTLAGTDEKPPAGQTSAGDQVIGELGDEVDNASVAEGDIPYSESPSMDHSPAELDKLLDEVIALGSDNTVEPPVDQDGTSDFAGERSKSDVLGDTNTQQIEASSTADVAEEGSTKPESMDKDTSDTKVDGQSHLDAHANDQAEATNGEDSSVTEGKQPETIQDAAGEESRPFVAERDRMYTGDFEDDSGNKPIKYIAPSMLTRKNTNIINARSAAIIHAKVPKIPYIPRLGRTTTQIFFAFLYLLTQRDWVETQAEYLKNKMGFFQSVLPQLEYPNPLRHFLTKKAYLKRLQQTMVATARKEWEPPEKGKEFEVPGIYDDFDEEHPNFNDITIPYIIWHRQEDYEGAALTDLLLAKTEKDKERDVMRAAKNLDPTRLSSRTVELFRLVDDPEELFERIKELQEQVTKQARELEEKSLEPPPPATEEEFLERYTYYLPKKPEEVAAIRAAEKERLAREKLNNPEPEPSEEVKNASKSLTSVNAKKQDFKIKKSKSESYARPVRASKLRATKKMAESYAEYDDAFAEQEEPADMGQMEEGYGMNEYGYHQQGFVEEPTEDQSPFMHTTSGYDGVEYAHSAEVQDQGAGYYEETSQETYDHEEDEARSEQSDDEVDEDLREDDPYLDEGYSYAEDEHYQEDEHRTFHNGDVDNVPEDEVVKQHDYQQEEYDYQEYGFSPEDEQQDFYNQDSYNAPEDEFMEQDQYEEDEQDINNNVAQTYAGDEDDHRSWEVPPLPYLAHTHNSSSYHPPLKTSSSLSQATSTPNYTDRNINNNSQSPQLPTPPSLLAPSLLLPTPVQGTLPQLPQGKKLTLKIRIPSDWKASSSPSAAQDALLSPPHPSAGGKTIAGYNSPPSYPFTGGKTLSDYTQPSLQPHPSTGGKTLSDYQPSKPSEPKATATAKTKAKSAPKPKPTPKQPKSKANTTGSKNNKKRKRTEEEMDDDYDFEMGLAGLHDDEDDEDFVPGGDGGKKKGKKMGKQAAGGNARGRKKGRF